MNFTTDISDNKAAYNDSAKANEMFERIDLASGMLIDKLPEQRQLITQVLQHGFNKI